MLDTEVASTSHVDIPQTEGEVLVPVDVSVPEDVQPLDSTAGSEPVKQDEATGVLEVDDKGKVEKDYGSLTPRERTVAALVTAQKRIEKGLADATLPEELREVARTALTYTGKKDAENTQALQALGNVLATLSTPDTNRLLQEITKHQRFTTDLDAQIYTEAEWMEMRDKYPDAADQEGFDKSARIVYEFPSEAEAMPVNPEDFLMQEGIDALSAKRDGGEVLGAEQQQQLKLFELAAAAKGEGGLLLKIQLLQKLGIDSSQDATLAQRLEVAGKKLDDLLQAAGVKSEDIELLSSLSSSDVSAFMDKGINLRIDGLDTFIFGKKLTVEEMQAMLNALPLSQEKKDALSKLPMGLPIGLGLLFGLLSLGYAVGKASIKEARK